MHIHIEYKKARPLCPCVRSSGANKNGVLRSAEVGTWSYASWFYRHSWALYFILHVYIFTFFLLICSVIFYSFEEFLIRISHILIFTLIFIRIYIIYYSDETSLKWDRVTTGLLTALPTRRPELESLSLIFIFIFG